MTEQCRGKGKLYRITGTNITIEEESRWLAHLIALTLPNVKDPTLTRVIEQ